MHKAFKATAASVVLFALMPVAQAQTTSDGAVTTTNSSTNDDDFPYGLLGLLGLAGLFGLKRNDHDRVKTRP